jgi:hypothetical protein
MRSFWSDPYLWIHLAGLAALPLWLELCWLGLAVGDPVLPFWLELLLIAALGIGPVFWMQWQRPFYIFSLIAVALKPALLTADQRRLLTLFNAPRHRYLAIAGAILAFLALRQLYVLAPIAAAVTPFPSESRWLGVLIAAIAFLGVNLFLQVPLSVMSVLFTGDSAFAATTPYPLERIPSDFTLLGIPVKQILPAVIPEPLPQTAPVATSVTSAAPTGSDLSASDPAIPASELPPPPEAAALSAETSGTTEMPDVDAEDWFESGLSAETSGTTEMPDVATEDWFEANPSATIPASELERADGDAATEPITTEGVTEGATEEALDSDPQEPVATNLPVPVLEETGSSPVDLSSSLADSVSETAAEPSSASEAIPGVGELTDPLEILSPEAIAPPEASTTLEDNTTIEEFIAAPEEMSPLAETMSDAVAPGEPAIEVAELDHPQANLNSEPETRPEISTVSGISSDAVESNHPEPDSQPESEPSAASEAALPDSDPLPSTYRPPENHTE